MIVADRDEIGERHARQVRDSLAAVGVVAEVVQALEGSDASDHLAAGHPLEEFEPIDLGPAEDDKTPFVGLSHDEVLKLKFEGERQLVDELVEAGVLGVIAGIPETYKSWVAQAITIGIARGEGEILGRRVVAQGNTGYFWQDDSRRNEAERIQTFERVRANPAGLPVRWFLNEGLELPRDVERLRATVKEHTLCLVVIDSFYNVALADLKDRDAGQIVAALKAQVCDPTGCTVLIVDHMPWATDSNRSRLRTYGDVFKGAAARFGIYIDAERTKLYVEARGNNVRGFKRTPAYWDAEALELRLVDKDEVDEEELDGRVLEYVTGHPGAVTKTVEDEVEGGRESIRKSLERLASHKLLASGPGRHPRGKYWYPANHEGLHSPGEWLAIPGDMSPGPLQGLQSPDSPTPRRGGESPGDKKNGGSES